MALGRNIFIDYTLEQCAAVQAEADLFASLEHDSNKVGQYLSSFQFVLISQATMIQVSFSLASLKHDSNNVGQMCLAIHFSVTSSAMKMLVFLLFLTACNGHRKQDIFWHTYIHTYIHTYMHLWYPQVRALLTHNTATETNIIHACIHTHTLWTHPQIQALLARNTATENKMLSQDDALVVAMADALGVSTSRYINYPSLWQAMCIRHVHLGV